jgi:pilus assembly protein CpaB
MALSPGGRSQWLLLVALLLGLLAAGLTWIGLRNAAAQQQETQRGAAMTTVVRARQEIPPRTVITPEMIEQVEIRQDQVRPSDIRDPAQAIGRNTRQTIYAGETVGFDKLFAERAEAGLAFTIPEGRRAVSAPISELTGAGGLILPGDRVDVMAVCRAALEGAQQPAQGGGTVRYGEHVKTAIVLQNIEVLAIAQQLTGTTPPPSTAQQITGTPVPRDVQRTTPQPLPQARTVTLAVTPEEAERLVAHQQICELHLVLRRFNDNRVDGVPPFEVNYGIVR